MSSEFAKELHETVEFFKDINPWMTEEEAMEGAIEYLKKHNPEFFEKPKESNDDDFPVWIFDIYTGIDCILILSKYFQDQDDKLSDGESIDKANDIYSRVRHRYFIGDESIPRDFEAEKIFIEAIVEPYQKEKSQQMNDPSPATIAVESDSSSQEVNFDPSNPALGYFQQHPVNPMFLHPIHKVDEPPKAPKNIAPEDIVQGNLNNINFSGLVKPASTQQVPDVINKPLVNPESVLPVTENLYSNDVIIAKFPKIPLKQIEQIANKNGVSVLFEEYPWVNLVSVTAVDSFGRIIAPMCFTIDTGEIIDPRAKLIATNPKINPTTPVELGNIYELFVIDTKNHNRKVLDEKLINDIFTAGILNISKKEMYSKEYKELNTKLALITMPTKGITKEMRNALQDYLLKMDKNGDFDKAISMSPGCRFVFKTEQLDRDHLSDFILINEGVPKFYGTPVVQVNPIIIESKDGKVSIKVGRA